ncbi:MAG: hypothetical protein LBQ88_00255 [Treponema sp.]|jgi:hypothetical protein|nr:hypothetical protein [Treponema sp.]
MNSLFDNNGFWAVLGILLGSGINFLFWLIQFRLQAKEQKKIDKYKKVEELCDFFMAFESKIKEVYGAARTGTAVSFFSENHGYWESIPTLKMRILVQTFFPACLDEYDEFQTAVINFNILITESMRQGQILPRELNNTYIVIETKRNVFINSLTDRYSKNMRS